MENLNDNNNPAMLSKDTDLTSSRTAKALEQIVKELSGISKGSKDRSKNVTKDEKSNSVSVNSVASHAAATIANPAGEALNIAANIGKAIANAMLDTVLTSANKANSEMQKATLEDPKEELNKIVRERARLGVKTSDSEMDQLMSQLALPNQRAAEATRKLEVNTAGSVVMGAASEYIFGGNIQKGFAEMGQWGGLLKSKISTWNRDLHNEEARKGARFITLDGSLEGE